MKKIWRIALSTVLGTLLLAAGAVLSGMNVVDVAATVATIFGVVVVVLGLIELIGS